MVTFGEQVQLVLWEITETEEHKIRELVVVDLGVDLGSCPDTSSMNRQSGESDHLDCVTDESVFVAKSDRFGNVPGHNISRGTKVSSFQNDQSYCK